MIDYELALRNKGFTKQPDGSWSKTSPYPRSDVSNAERQRNPGNEPMASAPPANINSKRRLVRLTSLRYRLIDARNLWDKYFVDSLVSAGILIDDSPRWCQVEVSQILIPSDSIERVLIEVFDL